jgi:hypothetical protein
MPTNPDRIQTDLRTESPRFHLGASLLRDTQVLGTTRRPVFRNYQCEASGVRADSASATPVDPRSMVAIIGVCLGAGLLTIFVIANL